MKKNPVLVVWVAVLVLVVLGMAGAGYKLYRMKQAKAAQVWQSELPLPIPEGLESSGYEDFAKSMEEGFERYEVIRPVIEELGLIAHWQAADMDAALARIKEATEVQVKDGTVVLITRDKDKETAGKLQMALRQSFDRVNLQQRYGLPGR